VHWIGHYGTLGTPESSWSPCVIDNISAEGAGTVVQGGRAVDVGQQIAIDIERIGVTPVGLRVNGVVRHVSEQEPDDVVFGVELRFSTREELATARQLFAG